MIFLIALLFSVKNVVMMGSMESPAIQAKKNKRKKEKFKKLWSVGKTIITMRSIEGTYLKGAAKSTGMTVFLVSSEKKHSV